MQSPDPTEIHLYGIDFIDANNGWIAGAYVDDGEIWKTTDGGATWSLQFVDDFSNFDDIDMIDATNGWAIGDRIYKTTNGGATWSASELPRGVGGVKIQFFFSDARVYVYSSGGFD